MQLLIATPLYPPDIGGPATDSSAIVQCLHSLGEDARVVSFSQVRTLPRIVRHLRYAWLLIRAGRGVDAVVAFDTLPVALPALLASILLRVPLIVRVPGDYAWEQGTQRFGVQDTIEDFQQKRYGLRVETLRWLQRFILRRAALVLVPSDFFVRLMDTWGIDQARIQRVYLGLPAEEKGVSIPVTNEKVMFSLGRFVPWKGFRLLIDLLPELPGWKLMIAGDGPEHTAIAQYAQQHGVSARVLLPGMISREEVMGWYRRADAFVLNTSQENFSFQVLEAMREGSAIITTRIGSLPELVTDGVEGVLLEPNDRTAFLEAVRSIEQEPERWKARREAARRKAHVFSIEASARGSVEAIRSVCI